MSTPVDDEEAELAFLITVWNINIELGRALRRGFAILSATANGVSVERDTTVTVADTNRAPTVNVEEHDESGA